MNRFKFIRSLFFIVIVVSCSQINTSSRDHYYEGSPFRHGIIPVTTEMRIQQVGKIDENSAVRGRRIYTENCMSCHGVEGRGDGEKARYLSKRPADLSELANTVPNFKFFMMVSQKDRKMPGWKKVFSKQDIEDLENYLRLLGKHRDS